MNQVLIIKCLLSAGVIGGIGISGTYFGTRTTVEQHFLSSKDKNGEEDWDTAINSLFSGDDNSANKANSEQFKTLKKEEKNNLIKVCNEMYGKTYKSFWKENISKELLTEIGTYCFKNK